MKPARPRAQGAGNIRPCGASHCITMRMTSLRLFFFLASAVVPAALAASVPDDASEVTPLGVGDAVPQAQVRTADGASIDVRSLTRGRPAVYVFYRGGWCPYCNEHLADLAGIEEDLEELGYRVFAISPDRPEKVAEAAAESAANYHLLSDSAMDAARAFGVAFRVDDADFERLRGFGIDLEASSGRSHRLLPVPAVFLADASGKILYSYHDADYRERLSGADLLRVAEAASGADRLAVLWTSGDPEVAHRVALMYTHAAMRQGWFSEVRLIIWGPSQRLLVADKDIQAYVAKLQDAGVEVKACVVCADSYGIAEQVAALGIEVKPMGVPLTRHLKAASWKVLTF